MNIKIYYYKSSHTDPYNDWDMKTYKKIYPTKQDLKTGYVLLPIPSSHWNQFDLPTTKKNVPDALFHIMNQYTTNPMARKSANDPQGDKMQQWIRDHHTHTSMSVGDVVIVDGTMYVCDTMGWKEI